MTEETKPGALQTQPVLGAHAIAAAAQAAIIAVVTMLASFGWISVNPEQMGAVERTLAALAALLVLVAPQTMALFWARNQVTPLANPRTEDGRAGVIVARQDLTPQMMAQIVQAEAQNAQREWPE